MKRLTRGEVEAERLLRAARTIAVIGGSPRRGSRTDAVVSYLHQAGFDVYPVRPDRAEIAGLTSWPTLANVPGTVDLVLVVAGRVARPTLDEAARKGARAIWLDPGVTGTGLDGAPLPVIRDRDITVEQRHTEQSAGQPRRRGARTGTRGRERGRDTGWAERGGGGKRGGGGVRAVLDEKKMPRSGYRSRREP